MTEPRDLGIVVIPLALLGVVLTIIAVVNSIDNLTLAIQGCGG